MCRRFFGFVVVFCLFALVGCWYGDGGSGSQSGGNPATITDDSAFEAADPMAIKWREFDPRNLPEYKELPEPGVNEAAIMGMEEIPSRAKSSNGFYNLLRDDLLDGAEGEVRLDFYGSGYTTDIYGDYLGSRIVSANSFFAGTAEEKVKAQEYFIHAITYSEISGYVFQADAHVIFYPGETNRVLFSFRSTGSVQIPCYISNPAGIYSQSRYDMYQATLKANSAYVWHGPCYNPERGLEFTISYSYNMISDQPEEMELSVTASDGFRIMKFTFNLLDILTRVRPLELVAEEVPTGTIQYDGEFEFEKREIAIDLEDGQIVNFPLIVTGTVSGITQVLVEIEGKGVFDCSHSKVVDIVDVAGGVYSATFQKEDVANLKSGDTLIVGALDYEFVHNPDMSRELDAVRVEVIFHDVSILLQKDFFVPDKNILNPAGVPGQTEVNIGSFLVIANEDFEATDFIASSHDYPLGLCLQNLRVVKNGHQIGAIISTLSSDYVPASYTFSQSQPMTKSYAYVFSLYADVKNGLESPVIFNVKFSVAGYTASGEHFQTPFVEGQDIYIAL